ncbi:MAG TPA: FAD-dependent oxidoreductase [Tepidisphaeraceae bacterium]|nr:FAD-dependent oxidoreductase [Tepidisphaeraceae bacterium]
MRVPLVLLVVAALLTAPSPAAPPAPVDVLVYGATPGGVCAAIAAAREGAAVVLLEPTAHVGGVNTGGLSFSDSNQTVRSTVRGLFEEWHERVAKDYAARGVKLPYDVAVKDQSVWTYEPHVAARVTKAMLDEANVRVLPNHAITGVKKQGARIESLQVAGQTFEARAFVDATYEGDLMAAAGVSWTIGREGRKEFGETLAGKQYPKAKIAISGLDDAGKRLPLITTTDAGPADAGDRHVMVYSFRLCLTKDPANRVPFPKPERYDPARFEVVRRYYKQEKRPHVLWDLYPLPGDKFDANNGIGKQFSMGLVGGADGWCEADAAGRAKLWEAHKQYTLEFYHFLTTDPDVPAAQRKQLAELGLCRDEFPATGHWSPQLYVREGRRMKGIYVLSQKDVMTDPHKDDAIAVSSFPIDSHDCQRVGTADAVVNEGTIMPVRVPGRRHGYAYHVPYRAILPRADECDNLIVPVALSATHVALSSIRVEPTWMILGQSAGVAAAQSAKAGVAVQALPYATLRERLIAQKQVLDLPVLAPIEPGKPAAVGPGATDPKSPPGLVVDDAAADLEGEWDRSANFKPHVGAGYVHDNRRADGKSSAVFKFKIPKAGRYDLRLAYSAHETRATNVPVVVRSGGRETTLTADQTRPLAPGDPFRTIGTVDLAADGETTVTISNEKTNGFVIVDAVQLVEAK